MDEFPPQHPGDKSPSVMEGLAQAVAFAHQLGNSVVSCSVHSGAVKHQLIDLEELHHAISATASVLVELASFLSLEDSSPSVVKPTGMTAVESLVSQTDAVFRKIVILLLKASTKDPETADFGTGDDVGHPRELTPTRLASVVREDHSDWLRPRVRLCNERLAIVCLDLQVHSSIFKLARHQSSQAVGNAGRFDEELAMRAFAERWLTLRERHKKRDLKEQEERFRLCSLKDDDVSECDNASVDDGRSERGSLTSTVVVVETTSQTWQKPEKEPKIYQPPVYVPQVNAVGPGPTPDSTAEKAKPDPAVKSKSPQEGHKLFASFNRRLKGLFSHEARTLQAVGFRGQASVLEAWVIGFQSPNCIVKLPLTSDLVFDDLRDEARKSKKSHCEKILDMGPTERQAIDDAKLRGTLMDLRSRTLVHISESRTDLGYSNSSWPMSQRFVVYLAVGEPVETVQLIDAAGEETSVPLDRNLFWPATSWASKKNRGPPYHPHNMRYEMYDIVAEDGTKYFHGQWPSSARPGDKFTLRRRWPPGGCPPPPGWNPPPRPVSISSRSSSVGSEPSWEMMVELGFADQEPVEPTDDEPEVRLSDLMRDLTHAPDTEFAADVAEGVLGPLRDDSDDDDYTTSTVD